MEKYLEWRVAEHDHYERSADWFWVVGTVLLVIIALAAYFHIFLLVIIGVLGGGLIFYFAVVPPREISCAIVDRGIIVENELFPFDNISSFWVFDQEHRRKLVIETKRYALPHTFIPLGETDPNAVRLELKRHLPEKEYRLSLSDCLTEYLGL